MIQLDFKKALLLPFSGKEWFLRLLVLSILSIRELRGVNSDIIILHVALFILTAIFWGYFSQYAHNIFNNISIELPSWKLDFKKYLKTGFICSIGYLINVIIVSFIFLSLSDIASKFHMLHLKNLSNGLLQFVMVVMFFVVPCLYAQKFKFIDMLNYPKLFNIVSNSKLEFLTCTLICFVSNQLIQFIFPFLKIAYIQIILTSFLWAIVSIVLFNLLIQSFLLSKQRDM